MYSNACIYTKTSILNFLYSNFGCFENIYEDWSCSVFGQNRPNGQNHVMHLPIPKAYGGAWDQPCPLVLAQIPYSAIFHVV